MLACSYNIAAVVHESSLMLHVTDVTLYLTLNHLFNRISFPFIIANYESKVQKHSLYSWKYPQRLSVGILGWRLAKSNSETENLPSCFVQYDLRELSLVREHVCK